MNQNHLPNRIGQYIEHLEETGNPYEPGDVRDGEWHDVTVTWGQDGPPDVWVDDDGHLKYR